MGVPVGMSLLPRLIRALQAFGPAAGTSCPGEPGRPDRAAPLRHADFAMAGMGRGERVVARRCCSATTRISPRNARSAASGRGGVYGSIQPRSSRGRFVAFGGDVYAESSIPRSRDGCRSRRRRLGYRCHDRRYTHEVQVIPITPLGRRPRHSPQLSSSVDRRRRGRGCPLCRSAATLLDGSSSS